MTDVLAYSLHVSLIVLLAMLVER